MDQHIPSYKRELLFSGCILALATLTLTCACIVGHFSLLQLGTKDFLIALYLLVAIVAAYHFPINIGMHSKVQMSSVPIYLLVVLLHPVLAAFTAGIGILIAESSVRAKRQNHVSDVLLQTGRQVFLILFVSWVMQLSLLLTTDHTLVWIIVALNLLVFDFLSFGLQQRLLVQESFWPMVSGCFREAGLTEGAQYLVGWVGALAVTREVWALVALLIPATIVFMACKRSKDLSQNTRKLLESMADAVDLRDAYTGGHSKRVREYASQILKQLGIYGPEATLIVAAARVHDIGKIAIPDAVLHKVGRLNAAECALMETHAEQGAELLKRYPEFAQGMKIVRHHHEHWDGSGYPYKLKGEEIPFGARVIAVADSFDAMTSDRPYRKGMSVTRAASILRDGRNKQWEPTIVDAFLTSLGVPLEGEASNEGRTLEFISPVQDEAVMFGNASS